MTSQLVGIKSKDPTCWMSSDDARWLLGFTRLANVNLVHSDGLTFSEPHPLSARRDQRTWTSWRSSFDSGRINCRILAEQESLENEVRDVRRWMNPLVSLFGRCFSWVDRQTSRGSGTEPGNVLDVPELSESGWNGVRKFWVPSKSGPNRVRRVHW